MRDYAQIGVGREARRTYHLNEVSIVPARRTRSSKDVDTQWHIDAYTFDIPFVSHPTDALADPDFVAEFGAQGGLGVLNAEGLVGRCSDVKAALAEVAELVNNFDEDGAVRRLQELHAQPLDGDLLAERIAQVRASGQTVAVRVSPQHARELAPKVIKAGAELLFIQGTLISAEHVQADGTPLNLKEFIGSLDVPVIAGCVSDYATATHLMRTGAAGVIVSGTHGSFSFDPILGIGGGLATALADVSAARRDYLDETGGRYVHILADSDEIYTSADAVKAIACGADAVVLGLPLAVATEAAAGGAYWTHSAAHPQLPRGVVLSAGTVTLDGEQIAEKVRQVPLAEVLHGPAHNLQGATNFVGALKRAMAKCGYSDVKQFQKVPLTVSGLS